jgi:hypothetical protein
VHPTWIAALCLVSAAVAQSPAGERPVAGDPRPGFVLYQQRWRLPQEVAYLQRAAHLRGGAAASAGALAAGAKRASPVRKGSRTARAHGLVTVRAQQVQLLGLEHVTVSVGTGQVRLMLPRTQSISIGSTVSLPFR